MTRAEAKAKTRAAVLDAAKRLFTLDGYYATTLRGIAARAGYSTGAVFHQFSGKDELWRETMGCEPPTEARCAELQQALSGLLTGAKETLLTIGMQQFPVTCRNLWDQVRASEAVIGGSDAQA